MMLKVCNRKSKTDCAACAISTITGIKYETVLKTLLPNRKKYQRYGATESEVIRALNKLGYLSKEYKVNFKNLRKVNHHLLMIVKFTYKQTDKTRLHAMIWDARRKKIIDGPEIDSIYFFKKYSKYEYDYEKISIKKCFKIVKMNNKLLAKQKFKVLK